MIDDVTSLATAGEPGQVRSSLWGSIKKNQTVRFIMYHNVMAVSNSRLFSGR